MLSNLGFVILLVLKPEYQSLYAKYVVKDKTTDITTDLHLPADAAAGGVSKKAYNLQGLPVSGVNRKGVVIESGRKTLYK